MKKLLATTAVALVAMASAASAQSVLERVLGQIDNATNLAQVNGTFANIAENIGSPEVAYVDDSGVSLTPAEFDVIVLDTLASAIDDGYYFLNVDDVWENADTGVLYSSYQAMQNALESDILNGGNAYTGEETLARVVTGGLSGIDGSITNVIDGITDVTQEAVAGTVTAIEYNMPTFDFGDMATTALGAVNTGDITLGVNSSVDNAKTSTTEALSSIMTQLGGSTDTGAIVLNVASNMTGINGSISNTMEEVNGSIGNLSTTALGAVNTGTIVSGVNAAVQGITGVTAGQSGL
jgi:hypothetical protein